MNRHLLSLIYTIYKNTVLLGVVLFTKYLGKLVAHDSTWARIVQNNY